MMEKLPPLFPDASEFQLASDDQYRRKWKTVHDNIEVPSSFYGPDDLTTINVTKWNRSLNTSIKYLREPGVSDQWQVPAYTVNTRTGDCEDFAILKYATLLRSGLSEDRLRLVIGHIAAMPEPLAHAWCGAYLQDHWRVLDNKFHMLIKPEEYINWRPTVAVWDDDQAIHFGRPVVLSEFV